MTLTPSEKIQILKLISFFFYKQDLLVINFLIINFLTLVFFMSAVYSTSIKQKTKNQTPFFLIPNSWQVFVEIIYDVLSRLLFSNVNVEKYLPCIHMIFVFTTFKNLICLLPFWQMGFQDSVSSSQGGVWVFNKHLPFLLGIAVPFVVWLFVCTVYYFVEFRGLNSSKFLHSKKLEDACRTAPMSLFFFLMLTVAVNDNWDIPTTLLEEVPVEQPELTPVNPFHRSAPVSPYSVTTQETVGDAFFDELEQIFRFFKAKGFTVKRVLNVLYTVPDSFWSLSFWEKVATVEESLNKEDAAVNVLSPEIAFIVNASLVLILWVVFLRHFDGGDSF
jgi:F0F1-type ATP synthase membrane subunit a